MTRINLIPPQELHQKHLVAEYRELPRIFGQAAAAHARGELPTDRRNPLAYTLGKGHVRFFYSRLSFLLVRQGHLIDEMMARGYAPKFSVVELTQKVQHLPQDWWQNYEPTPEAIALSRARIIERSSQW